MSFKDDVRTGLTAPNKQISSRYFYDAAGDKLFQAIMHLPEYYLTRSEMEIMQNNALNMIHALGWGEVEFDLVEFGAGDGLKSKVFMKSLLQNTSKFRYIPIDISADVLVDLKASCEEELPGVEVEPIHAEYFQALDQLGSNSHRPKLVLFLGSSIGNFLHDRSVLFLSNLHKYLTTDDRILIGFDLKKNPNTILAAYNDSQGVTRAFNVNVLKRINRELEADFDLNAFSHYPFYDPETGLAKSYLVSEKSQTVVIKSLDLVVEFKPGEIIHTEISRKYDEGSIHQIFKEASFEVVKHFYDCRHYFVDTLAKPK